MPRAPLRRILFGNGTSRYPDDAAIAWLRGRAAKGYAPALDEPKRLGLQP